MRFCDCFFKEVLTFHIKGVRHDKSLLLVQVRNIQKSISVLYIPPTLFWRCIDLFLDRIYLDASLQGFLHFQSLVDSFGTAEVFIVTFPSIRQSSAMNDIIQAVLKSVVEIVKGFTVLDAGLDVRTKVLIEGTLTTIVREVSVNQCRFRDIPLCYSFLKSGDNCCSGVVTWSGLCCW